MNEIFDWPTNLVPLNMGIRTPRKTIGNTSSLSGLGQTTPAIRPPFGAVLEFDALTGEEVLTWRALLGLLEGRANIVRLPLFDLWLATSDGAIGAGSTTHSDGSPFSDGAHYLTTDLSGVTVTGVQGQRHVDADFGSNGQLLKAGQFFGLGDRPYLASGVSWTGSVARIRAVPTLREAVTDQPLRLRPTMLARLASDDEGQTMLQQMRVARPQVEFVEAFP